MGKFDRESRLKLASADLGSDVIRAGLAEFFPSISASDGLIKPFHSKLFESERRQYCGPFIP